MIGTGRALELESRGGEGGRGGGGGGGGGDLGDCHGWDE